MSQNKAELSSNERSQLLKLARSVIGAELDPSIQVDRPANISDALAEERGCFVTLEIGGALRGCIGTLNPRDTLVSNVEENALNAAFKDPRFAPLRRDEFDRVRIEISVLSKPAPLLHHQPQELLDVLQPNLHGVILTKDWHSATFLPQVWSQLPDKIQFLEHLCIKAGLTPESWMDPAVGIKIYTVEHFSE